MAGVNGRLLSDFAKSEVFEDSVWATGGSVGNSELTDLWLTFWLLCHQHFLWEETWLEKQMGS